MLCRLALLTLVGALSACDAPPQGKESMRPATPVEVAPAAPSRQQLAELSAECEKKARDEFRRAWPAGNLDTADRQTTANFTSHYNAKWNTCFYLLTVSSATKKNGQGSASTGTLSKMLYDIDERELYGEYLGPATAGSPSVNFPKTCRVVSLYCASEREWKVLVEPFMEE